MRPHSASRLAAMQCFYLAVFCFLAYFLHSGEALRCWSCDSRGNRHCGDPFNKTRVALYDCERDRSPHSYGQIHNFACKKYKYMYNGDEVIVRSCTSDAHTACNPSNYASDKETFCEICHDDGCNGAFKQATSLYLTVLLPASLWALATKVL